MGGILSFAETLKAEKQWRSHQSGHRQSRFLCALTMGVHVIRFSGVATQFKWSLYMSTKISNFDVIRSN
jgi:hypothetical protein